MENKIYPDLYLEESYEEYDDLNTTIIRGFKTELDERMEEMKVFSPYMEILRRHRNKEGAVLPIPELCMAVLTFLLYEGRLKFKGLLFTEIQAFIKNAVQQLMNKELSREEAQSLTGEILDELQNNGTNYIVRYYSFTAGSYREKHVKLIEMKLSDEDGKLYYYITKHGLDFYLKTKEFPEESQITVNLLLFKMQLEKGAYQYAFDTIKRLNMEVQRKLERKEYILGLLMAGGREGSSAYREYHQSTMLQFQEESELFEQSRNLLRDTFDDLNNKLTRNTITAKEKRALQMIRRIEREMRKAIAGHETLLNEATSLIKEYDRILEMRRRSAFTERFNFSGEFDKLVSKALPPQNMKYLWEPLIKPFIRKGFNPLKMFIPQKLTREDEGTDSSFEEKAEKSPAVTIDQIVQARVAQNFVIYAASLLSSLFQKDTLQSGLNADYGNDLDLKSWCDVLSGQYGSESITNGDFISFLIILNRGKETGSRIKCYDLGSVEYEARPDTAEDRELRTIEDVLLAAAVTCSIPPEKIRLEVESFEDADIDLGWGIKVTNMKFRG